MKAIVRLLKAEQIKFRKSPAFFLTLGAPLFLAVLVFFIYFFRADKIISNAEESMASYFGNALTFLIILLPLFVVLLNILIFNIEYRSNMFKVLYSFPVGRKNVILAKFIMTVTLFILSGLIFLIAMLLGFLLNSIRYEELFYFEISAFWKHSYILIQLLLTSILMLTLQFWFSYRWKNVIISIAIGFAAFMSYIILIKGWKYIIYHPYAFPSIALKSLNENILIIPSQFWYSLLGSIVVLFIVIIESKNKQIVD